MSSLLSLLSLSFYSSLATYFFFFFNDTATTEIYTLSLHDALPICYAQAVELLCGSDLGQAAGQLAMPVEVWVGEDRKSTRLNSSHSQISYAVFCLKKKKKKKIKQLTPMK